MIFIINFFTPFKKCIDKLKNYGCSTSESIICRCFLYKWNVLQEKYFRIIFDKPVMFKWLSYLSEFISLRDFQLITQTSSQKADGQNTRMLAHEVNCWPVLLCIYFTAYNWDPAMFKPLSCIFVNLCDFHLITQASSQKIYEQTVQMYYCMSVGYTMSWFLPIYSSTTHRIIKFRFVQTNAIINGSLLRVRFSH